MIAGSSNRAASQNGVVPTHCALSAKSALYLLVGVPLRERSVRIGTVRQNRLHEVAIASTRTEFRYVYRNVVYRNSCLSTGLLVECARVNGVWNANVGTACASGLSDWIRLSHVLAQP